MVEPRHYQGPEQCVIGCIYLVIADAVEQCPVDNLRADQPELTLSQARKYPVVCNGFIIKLEKGNTLLMFFNPSIPSFDEQADFFDITATTYHLDTFPFAIHFLDDAHGGTARFVPLLLDKHTTKVALFSPDTAKWGILSSDGLPKK